MCVYYSNVPCLTLNHTRREMFPVRKAREKEGKRKEAKTFSPASFSALVRCKVHKRVNSNVCIKIQRVVVFFPAAPLQRYHIHTVLRLAVTFWSVLKLGKTAVEKNTSEVQHSLVCCLLWSFLSLHELHVLSQFLCEGFLKTEVRMRECEIKKSMHGDEE